jgi:glucose-6-phosphate isomerase
MNFDVSSKYFTPFGDDLDFDEGILKGYTNYVVRRASSMRHYYQDETALEALISNGDPIHYEVFEKTVPEEYGHLMMGISKLYPGTIGQEYFMTKGHYHAIVQTGEIYLCLKGAGYLIMKTSDNDFYALPLEKGKIVYVPPYWAHRSVNIGNEPLVSFFVYNAESGHNYGDIETEGFPKRVLKQNSKVVFV